ncbi:hypothetical protein QR680_014196 [Steinernema hermaphroditum]|uniref:Galactosylgalactosylxylosylprotein 3-beta-glucuronosyltransferase n=1 Tax=Steinernema hermaphroditum TaxID=289476 RepID=A0AA39IA55_9BILA|nr:hypothetical protein QR680_014196 [Steinernema hermaphroditum]
MNSHLLVRHSSDRLWDYELYKSRAEIHAYLAPEQKPSRGHMTCSLSLGRIVFHKGRRSNPNTIVAGTLRGLRCEMAIGGQSTNLSTKVIIAIALFFACQLLLLWSNFEDLDEKKASVEAAVARLERRKDVLQKKIMDLERESYRINKTLLRSEILLKDRLPLLKNSRDLPPIFFITPTHYRPAQKADLTRLAQTLKSVPNLVWIVVEDADRVSEGVAAVIKSSGLQYGHLHAQTPSHLKLNASDPNWKVPRGVMQRNQALSWIRTNFAASTRGVVYFGDDDNTYDWRLFNEMRSIRNVGVWPVGIVGGQLVETPLVSAENGSVIGFSAKWKPDRPFPIDMAAFAVNVSLLHSHPKTEFSYDVPRGYQESTFLVGLNLARFDLEPKAVNCTRVYVWHTRTENPKLIASDRRRFQLQKDLTEVERHSVL